MRYVTYADGSNRARPGVLEGQSVRPFSDRFGTLIDVIALDDAARQAALGALGAPLPLDTVKLLAPVRPHKNVFCIGRNYLAHAEEVARARFQQLDLPDVPTIFTKAPTAIADPEQTLVLDPSISPQYDWEAELAVVIGKRCRDVSEADAYSVIFGYTCLNDVTARDVQKRHMQWFKGKSLDHTCPLGPWIVAASEIAHPQALQISLRVNGVEKQHASTSAMIFPIDRIIAELSKGMTLEPGDVIATGTPEGVGIGRTPQEFLADGDEVEVELEHIGVLRNTVRLASPVGAAR